MSRFVIQTYKVIGTQVGREFTNAYLCEADDIDTVAAALGDLVDAEKACFLDVVTIVRARVSDQDPDTDSFVILNTATSGTRNTLGAGSYLPLYNTIRVDINVAGGGRPSRKYYRSPIMETDQENGELVSSVVTAMDSAVNNIISVMSAASAPLVDPDGQLLVSSSTRTAVQMRQLHRKRKKTPAPTP